MPKLARELAGEFTVFTYDRRGRGQSGDTAPYAPDREIEDVEAILDEAGGEAFVFGISSGAVIALEAARKLSGIRAVGVFEAPFVVDERRPPMSAYWNAIRAAIAKGDRREAVKLFLKCVGVPGFVVGLMRLFPVWPRLEAAAHTLPYDAAFVEEYQRGNPLPAAQWASVTVPTLVLDGGKSPTWLHTAMRSLAEVLPNAEYRTLPGQSHNVSAKAAAPVLSTFFQQVRRPSAPATA
jgi:pimeloyl-ACP methyl ester carboxylesterase